MDAATTVLSAMITPAVLISGAGTLLMSTSSRLGRATDRVRALTARFKVLVTPEGQQEPLAKDEKRMILGQLPRLSRRTRFLQRAMRSLYLAVSLLVMASIWIGASGLLGQELLSQVSALGPVLLAVAGAAALAYGAVLLSIESSLSALTTREEMRFLEALGIYYAGLLVDEVATP
ncbi:DUF2721 domain-containing protein [Deinococcus psychrotolerans]|uniref:DUF2721 domain-containing protein n=1 Tax=Deinococcus psychrotolerans TaxID=2489213 RepID=A0A3G8YDU3_9DEIO|nr:DUF2721 domain-containing protein [Deinococcus psychrotolerans]AZI43528.1 DUF2721 domain-containing protein [Deinococcus psychrotolerans]